MTDREPDATGAQSPRPHGAGMPRWVKVSLIVVAILIGLFVILQLAGVGGRHGPGRHMRHTGLPAREIAQEPAA